ncbi:hypothetical protein H4Q26_013121 [Puccinia striiformis f. sp. tritici PST-130]|nr:hypothetical protein H4Q26_013121 [Puccinia striiformis f. sp. tritici PST-130]
MFYSPTEMGIDAVVLMSLYYHPGSVRQENGTLFITTTTPIPLLISSPTSGHRKARKGGTIHCTTMRQWACKPVQGGLTIDANWRWTHKAGQDCYQGTKWDPTICANGDDCAKNCAIEGADYEKDYGVVPTGTDSVTLKFVTNKNVGSRMYLLDASGQKYQMFMLKNKQFSFDVDVSKLPCGINGALYLLLWTPMVPVPSTELGTVTLSVLEISNSLPERPIARAGRAKARSGYQQKMTVTTQFVTKDNTDRGELSEIRRVYVQDGKVIQNEAVKIKGMTKPTADSLTEEFCTANKQMTGDENHFGKNGGLKRLGDSMAKGMSADTFGAKRGTCEANTGDPTTVRAANPDASVTFSNVKIGPIVKVAADAAGGLLQRTD